MLTSEELLEIGFIVLESARARRLNSDDSEVGSVIKCQVMGRELYEEEDRRRGPGSSASVVGQRGNRTEAAAIRLSVPPTPWLSASMVPR